MTPAERTAALRAIDANFNRAVEGLRVVEDQARFVLNDGFLAGSCKQLRHDLTTALQSVCGSEQDRYAARDTLADVGTAITSPQETERQSLAQLAAANWQRVSQALRVIEEFAKLLGVSGSPFESFRYQTYTLAKAFVLNERSQQTWLGRQLYVLIDGESSEAEFAKLAQTLIEAGVHVLQLRDKRLDDRALLARGIHLRKLIDETASSDPKPLFIMNDRPDLAILTRADGVHVGQDELPVSEVRRLVGTTMQIGVSTHNLTQARAAVLAGADYLGCGPTFPSGTKHFADFPGTAFLQQVAAELSLPAFAIGGITLSNLSAVQATGFTRVAVSGVISQSIDPAAEVQRLLAALRS
ncbi:Thiamine-phosphate synthase [Anatilimnocola aggregata]|uniref:Thiamine-phosphate synthase n=1 Tax=Anatilimnocola aggregata TaxID=2528021 RepID=A0A517Y9F3_9BACT|nr:thiamine phosphate synthase [Anatilimnocola aggregata]QDU26858.1 Thiamine-phosphate synthase [Anatilimnocola aggregata]